MKPDATAFQLFCSYVNTFKTANFAAENDNDAKIVRYIIRPCYLNLLRSPVPPFAELDAYDIESKLTVTIKSPWSKIFNFTKNRKLEFPLFQKNNYEAWVKYFFPEIQKDLKLKSPEHIRAMYDTAIRDIMGAHSDALKGSLLKKELTELGNEEKEFEQKLELKALSSCY